MSQAQVLPGVPGGPYNITNVPQNPTFYTLPVLPQPSEPIPTGSPLKSGPAILVGDFSSVTQGEITTEQEPITRPAETPDVVFPA